MAFCDRQAYAVLFSSLFPANDYRPQRLSIMLSIAALSNSSNHHNAGQFQKSHKPYGNLPNPEKAAFLLVQ